jgi:hypothetical protein
MIANFELYRPNHRRIIARAGGYTFVSINDGSLMVRIKAKNGGYRLLEHLIFGVLEVCLTLMFSLGYLILNCCRQRGVSGTSIQNASIIAQHTGEMLAAMYESLKYPAGAAGKNEDEIVDSLSVPARTV